MKLYIILFVILLKVYSSYQFNIVLDSNSKLQNLLININEGVPEGNGNLIQNIQKYINESSAALWTATGNMKSNIRGVQFGTVYIVVPPTWNIAASENITWQQCGKGNIFISTPKENNFKAEPFTKQTGGCGDPGEFIRLPYTYFENGNAALKGREIMKEFTKFRYGVFPESLHKNQLTYYNGSSFSKSSCGSDIKWSLSRPDWICSLMDNDCTYQIDYSKDFNYSVMFDHNAKSSEYFCNDDTRPHNKYAPSIHNIKCNRRSIESVVLTHSDFNQSLPKNTFESTNFKIVKGSSRKIVFVLDVSGSMSGSPLEIMKNAAAYYIDKVVENDAQVGLVTFSDYGYILNQLLSMNSQSNRNQIISNIKNLRVIGGTNIPDGLRKGIQVLGGSMENNVTMFGTIFLLTDGVNGEEYTIWDNYFVINRIISKGLVVNTIGYGSSADPKLTILAEKSGGRFFNAQTNSAYTTLMDKFAFKASCESQNNSLVKILDGTTNAEISSGDNEFRLFYVDEFVGKDMLITITINITVQNYIISLLNAFNEEFFNTSSVSLTNTVTLSFGIVGNAKIGYYRLKFKSLTRVVKRATSPVSLKYGVSAVLNQNSTKVINPSGKLSQSEVQLVDSFTLVSAMVDLSTSGLENRDIVSVTLSMEYPSSGKLERQMFDNGLGCDSLAGDQIYTTCIYAKDLNSVGYYTISGTVEITLYSTSLNNGTEKIKRTVDLGTFRVVNISANIQDKIPPAKIDSVSLSILNQTNKDLKLDFQSTGDDGVIGNISAYKIRIFGPNETIVSTFQPSPPLLPISLIVNLQNATTNLPFTVSVKGVDKSGNEGEWSPEKFFSWDYYRSINNGTGETPTQVPTTTPVSLPRTTSVGTETPTQVPTTTPVSLPRTTSVGTELSNVIIFLIFNSFIILFYNFD